MPVSVSAEEVDEDTERRAGGRCIENGGGSPGRDAMSALLPHDGSIHSPGLMGNQPTTPVPDSLLGRESGSSPPRFDFPPPRLIGSTRCMIELGKQIGRIVGRPLNVLIVGPPGSGKKLVARTLHRVAGLSPESFQLIDCLHTPPESLLAFRASRTLCLDKLDELPYAEQGQFLQALREIHAGIPPSALRSAGPRILGTSRRDLLAEVRQGRFSSSLYDALAPAVLVLPPLAERRDDIPTLIAAFLDRFNAIFNKGIRSVSPCVLAALRGREWIGNVGELERTIYTAALNSQGEQLETEIPPDNQPFERSADPLQALFDQFILGCLREATGDLYVRVMSLVEQLLLERLLQATGGNRSRASQILGITRRTLQMKLTWPNVEQERPRAAAQNDPDRLLCRQNGSDAAF